MKKIYVAGPMSWGDKVKNIKKGMDAADELILAGYAPFVPHLSHFWHLMTDHPITYELWMKYDREWLLLCDALIRLPGKSRGADQEVRWARRHGIPVYKSVKAFLKSEGVVNDK